MEALANVWLTSSVEVVKVLSLATLSLLCLSKKQI